MNTFVRPVIVALVLAGTSPLSAGVMKPLSVTELATNAKVIVHGTVVSKTVQRDPEGRIFTRVNLEIAEVWKGQVEPAAFSIVHGGGTLGNERTQASIQVNYEIGEEVVVMLRLNQRKEGVTLGLVQGKFHVKTDLVSRQKFVSNVFHGKRDKAHDEKGEPGVTREPITLGELKRQVKGGQL